MDNRRTALGSTSTRDNEVMYGYHNDNLSTQAHLQNRSGALDGTSSAGTAHNQANSRFYGNHSNGSPLGTLRDLINQKTGVTSAAGQGLHQQSSTNQTSNNLYREEKPINFSSKRTTPLANEDSSLGRNGGIVDPRSTGKAGFGDSLGGYPTSTSTTGSTMQSSSLGGYSGTTGTTGATGSTMHPNTLGGFSGMSGTTGSTTQYSESNRVQPVSSSNTNMGQKSSGAAGTGVGTGTGLLGTYDFLRTDKADSNDTTTLDTSGPAHIAPPPGSREPPVTTNSSLRR